jgi:hypothetical protein
MPQDDDGQDTKHGLPEIDGGDSLTGFVKRIRGFEHGRENKRLR